MSEKIKKKKVSDLPKAVTIDGFYAFGTDNNNNSVKVPIELLKGNKGDIGESPIVGTNGNWWMNGVDSGQPSRGEDGTSIAYKVVFNVSQYNDKFDYADKTIARTAVPSTYRALGQQIAYQLASGKWMTEQYIGTNIDDWVITDNWEEIGFSKEKLLEIDGISYQTSSSTESDFINIIPSVDEVIDRYLQTDGYTVGGYGSSRYNTVFVPVQPNKKYLSNVQAPDNLPIPTILFYDSSKNILSTVKLIFGQYEFTTPPNTAFVRYNYIVKAANDIFIYPAPESSSTTDKLEVSLGVENLRNAVVKENSNENPNIIPSDVEMVNLAIGNYDGIANIKAWGYSTETYLPCEGATLYSTNVLSYPVLFYFYDSAKRYITYIGGADTGQPFGNFTTPANAKYIRFNTRSADGSVFYIRKPARSGIVISNLFIPEKNVLKEEVYGKPENIIPYSADGNSTTNAGGYFTYANQNIIRGRKIASVKLNVATAGIVSVAMYKGSGGAGIEWSKEVNCTIGENTIQIDRILPSDQYLGFKGSYKYKTGSVNSVGGSIDGVANTDLCVGVDCYAQTINAKFRYISVGDSVTAATVNYASFMAIKANFEHTNLAVGGANTMGTGGALINQVNQIPENFAGLITIHIGYNDLHNNNLGKPMGVLADVLAKPFESLDANASYAEAFRLNLETILRKAPNCIPVVIPPFYTEWTGKFALSIYREYQQAIAEYFAVPCLETYKNTKMSRLTLSRYYQDQVHPNADGHKAIATALYGDIKRIVAYQI